MDRTGIGARLIIIIYYRLPGTKLKKKFLRSLKMNMYELNLILAKTISLKNCNHMVSKDIKLN